MKKLLMLSTVTLLALGACKREMNTDTPENTTTQAMFKDVTNMNDLVVPANFNWESSRDVKINATITDTRFNKQHTITVYNADPAKGGKAISKGAANQNMPFATNVYLPTTVTELWIMKQSPDGGSLMQKATVTAGTVNVTFGTSSSSLGKTGCDDYDCDGVCDCDDCYPYDATKAYCNYYPCEDEYASVAFEDLWPYKGDYDMNDVVVDCNYKVVTNASNKVVWVQAKYKLRASGAALDNQFFMEFPVNKSLVSGISGATQETNPQSDVVLRIISSVRTVLPQWNTIPGMPTSPAVNYTVSFNINAASAPTLASFGLGMYDPFIATGAGRGYEVHLPGKTPTPLATAALFGTGDDNTNVGANRYYVSKVNGLPWAVTVPVSWSYPKEYADITTAYLRFDDWVFSNGASYTDWYSNTGAGYRNAANIY